jgi:hypothetical protein
MSKSTKKIKKLSSKIDNRLIKIELLVRRRKKVQRRATMLIINMYII